MLPESPRWLIDRDRHEEALEVLAAVNAHGDTEAPLVRLQYREIRDTIAFEKSRQLSLAQSFVAKGNRKRLAITATFSIVVMLSGTNIVTYYFGTMLSQAGIDDATKQLEINIILTSWTLVVSLLGAWYVDSVSRKTLCAISLAGQIVTFYLLAGLTALYGTSDNKSGIYASIAMIFLYNASYGVGVTPLTVVYPPEVLSYDIRGKEWRSYFDLAQAGKLTKKTKKNKKKQPLAWPCTLSRPSCPACWSPWPSHLRSMPSAGRRIS